MGILATIVVATVYLIIAELHPSKQFIPIAFSRAEKLLVVSQPYPSDLLPFEDLPIGDLQAASKIVSSSNLALVFIHAGYWHYASYKIAHTLQQLNARLSPALKVPMVTINCQFEDGQCFKTKFTTEIP